MLNQVQHDADFFIPAQAGIYYIKKVVSINTSKKQKNNNKSREQTNQQIDELTKKSIHSFQQNLHRSSFANLRF